ncbi:MAG: D-glycero-beta-D-manno-heptose-7-phosphate kinase [Acidobacteria bacterium]|nr:D-glycero-beta-D-manno-heptose-7-phosphate kinase [Acidobacteriota bacterium]
MTGSELLAAAGRLAGRRVLVVGDVILDRYVVGSVERISPEAPVPVVRWLREESRAGGAANVVHNLAALGLRPGIASAIGDDAAGDALAAMMAGWGVDAGGLVRVPGRPTVEKTRVLARHQQVLRLDREDDSPVSGPTAEAVLERALGALDAADAVVVSDYAKGLLDGRVLGPLLEAARRRGTPVVVDPKVRHFGLYAPATVITPNTLEAAGATGREIRGDADASAAAQVILDRLAIDAVLLTRGEHGMLLLERGGSPRFIHARAREVYDVTGAGDTVVAALAAALAAGLPLAAGAELANAAAAVAVGKLGTVAVSFDELRTALDTGGA